jgi:hypothetical protein
VIHLGEDNFTGFSNFLPKGGIENSPGRSVAKPWVSVEEIFSPVGALDFFVFGSYSDAIWRSRGMFRRCFMACWAIELWKGMSVAPTGLEIFFYNNPGLRSALPWAILCAPKAQITSGGRTHPSNSRLDSVADEQFSWVTGWIEAS